MKYHISNQSSVYVFFSSYNKLFLELCRTRSHQTDCIYIGLHRISRNAIQIRNQIEVCTCYFRLSRKITELMLENTVDFGKCFDIYEQVCTYVYICNYRHHFCDEFSSLLMWNKYLFSSIFYFHNLCKKYCFNINNDPTEFLHSIYFRTFF